MRAWRFDRYGGPDVLSLVELPTPRPGPGEVLIKILASGINPSDAKNVSGHFKTPLPRVPGRDFAGVIADGAGREGEEVWGSGPGFGVARDGVHAEYVVMPASWVTRRPARLSVEQASAVGVPWLAAWSALVTAGALQESETVLITGVSGAVGSAATQIAHERKARVIGAATSSANPSGADAVIDTGRQDLTREVLVLTDGRGVDLVLDVVGGALFEPCLKALRPGGRQIAIASHPQVVSFNLVDFYHRSARLIGVDTMALSGEEIAAVMGRLRRGFETGEYRPPAVQTWPFEQAVAAYDAVLTSKQPVHHILMMIT
ncbi:MAG: zinc-binding alcohol dehydrogenase family protein [Solirubrobacterales bacterium]|nr:zinc-binding alcohol dehydrogenase family protein [Solirubrobacterales bacterium]